MGRYTRVNRVSLSESRELVITDYVDIGKIYQRRYVLRDKDTDINLTDVVISGTVFNAIRYLCLYECTPPTMTDAQFLKAKHTLRGYYWALALWQQLGEDTDDIRLHIDR